MRPILTDRRRPAVLILGLALCAACVAARADPLEARRLLSAAQSARFKGNVAEERRLLESALAADPEPDQIARAEMRLGVLAWRISRNYESAARRLERAEATGARLHEILLARARMETTRGRFAEARAAADRALTAAGSRAERRAALLAFTSGVSEQILRSTLDKPPRAEEAAPAVIRGALARLEQAISEERGDFRICRTALLLSLYAGDGPAALDAWMGYFWLPDRAGADRFVGGQASSLSTILPAWTGEKSAEETDRIALALAASRLFPEAAVVALRFTPAGGAPGARVREVVEYARFLRRMVEATEEFYRGTAAGVESASLHQALEEAAGPLWAALNWTGPKRQLDIEALTGELSIRFGAETRTAPTWGFVLAHRLQEDTRQVVQYGRTVRVTFIAADVLTSTSYLPWLLDVPNALGGWAHEGKIVQIRKDWAVQAFRELTDAEEAGRFRSRLAEAEAENEIRARTQPAAFFVGPRDRLARRAAEGVLTSLKAKAVVPRQLRIAFLSEFTRLVDDCTFAHEGRHAIDSGLYGYEEKEFRARLSEVAFAPAPGLCLGSSFAPDTGEEHARANQRIMRGLLEWMTANRESIGGLDAGKPLLPQFHLLSDEQIRTAYASLDPLATEARVKSAPGKE